MLHKTKGIVLHSVPYSDKSAIINMYTEEFGRVSYMVYNHRNKKSGLSRALFMPLHILDMEVEHLNNRDLQRIKEAKPLCPVMEIYLNPVKNAIALFLAETLYRIVHEQEANPHLFDYLCRSIRYLNIADAGISNFHLAFLFQLSEYLGIHPNVRTFKAGRFYDLLNSEFTDSPPAHSNYLSREESIVFERLMRIKYENMSLYAFTRQERVNIIRRIIEYYRLHLTDFPEIKSLAVMQSLFD